MSKRCNVCNQIVSERDIDDYNAVWRYEVCDGKCELVYAHTSCIEGQTIVDYEDEEAKP